MISLIEQFRESAATKRSKAWSEYRVILSKAKSSREGVERLAELAAALDLTPADVECHAAIVKQAADLAASAAPADDPRLQAELEAAGKAYGDHAAETERLVLERAAKEGQLMDQVNGLGRRIDAGRGAKARLRKLREANCELFGVPPAQPVAVPQPSCVVDFSHIPQVVRSEPLSRVFQSLSPAPQDEHRYGVDPETLKGVQAEVQKLGG